MKVIIISSLFIFAISACNQNPKHPQANIINAGSAMTDVSISTFADSIDANSNSFERQISLVYQLGDISMYTEQYSQNGKPLMYKESKNNEGISSLSKTYYFKNDSLLLIKEHKKDNKDGKDFYQDSRTYVRNNIAFKRENRSAPSIDLLNHKTYAAPVKSDPGKAADTFLKDINTLHDAVNGVNDFEVFFDDITEGPNETHILLKSKRPNGYTSNIVVYDKDNFIDSLIKMPAVFKDKKLNIKWKIKDNEAIYVPVASSVTSAKGLNK